MELIEIAFKPQVPKKPKYGEPYWAENLEKWKQTNYLNGIEDKLVQRNVAMLLENQRLFREIHPDTPIEFLDVTAKVYSNLLANKLVSIQPLLGPAGLIYYSRFKWSEADQQISECIESEDVAAKTKRLKIILPEQINVDLLAEQIGTDIDLEILTDIRNNAGTVAKRTNPSPDDLHYVISELIMTISRKSLRKPNWMVVSPAFCEKYEETLNTFNNSGYKVYIVKDFLDKTLLLGWQGESLLGAGPMNATYIYCPYIPLACMPAVLDPDNFLPRIGLIARYGKKLLRDGAKAFGRLAIE